MPEFDVVRGGCASALRVRLRSGDSVKAESGALVSKTDDVLLGAGTDSTSFLSGLFGGAARSMLTGESFFLQTLRCPDSNGGEALVAPGEQGDISVLRLSPEGGGVGGGAAPVTLPAVLVSSGAFLCAEAGVDISTQVQGVGKGFFSGSGFFLMRCSGRGLLAVSCLGSCIRYDLQQGERRQVDNGHLVAWDARMPYTVGMATTGIFGTVASGEGLMCSFTGPGTVWLRTHKPQEPSPGGQRKRGSSGASPGAFIGICIFFFLVICFISIFLVAVMGADSGEGKRPTKRRGGNYGRIEF